MTSEAFQSILTVLQDLWPWLVGIGTVLLTAVGSAHVILNKRDIRAAIGWTGLILFSPFLGALAYYLFGINRVERRAARLVGGQEGRTTRGPAMPRLESAAQSEAPENLRMLSRTVERVSGMPLTEGNTITPLVNGDRAYPEMLRAIREARYSIALETYIFDNDRAGAQFVEALSAAVARGVQVRVLIDGVGARYSRPRVTKKLAQLGVTVAEFLPSKLPWASPYMNLRNHRKILVVDGRIGFAGGMNIREGCLIDTDPLHPIQDLHFRIDGPVVDHLFRAFAEDWTFSTAEKLEGQAWSSRTERAGNVPARGILDGPDEHFEALRLTLEAALGAARSSVRIVTPYFLPEASLIAALRLAALRGLEVDILLPEVNNLRIVQWAMSAQLWQFLDSGCRIWLTPPPFDHSKVFVVDNWWSLIGSANWDPRSLRLNFEFAVESYEPRLAEELLRITDEKMTRSRSVALEDVDGRALPLRLRDGVSRLFSPYL